MVEVTTLESTVLVCCVYIPPRLNDLDAFLSDVDTFSSKYSDVILVGDFDKNTLNPSSQTENLVTSLNCLDLYMVNDKPTHFSPGRN